jgi:hypothetical protein
MPSIASDYGNVGDIYIDTATGDFYGPKTEAGWPDTPFFTALSSATINAAVLNDRKIHTQSSASSTWNVTHELGGRPSVTIVDSAGTVVHGEVVYNSNTSITVLFSTPFSGYAYLT